MKSNKPKDIAKIFADGKLIDKALRNAAREALRQHKRAGLPVVVWRRGKIVWVGPEGIDVERASR